MSTSYENYSVTSQDYDSCKLDGSFCAARGRSLIAIGAELGGSQSATVDYHGLACKLASSCYKL